MPMSIHRMVRKVLDQKKVLNSIRKEGVVTTSEIAKEYKVSWNTAEKHLLELALDGKVRRVRKAGVNLWLIK